MQIFKTEYSRVPNSCSLPSNINFLKYFATPPPPPPPPPPHTHTHTHTHILFQQPCY